MQTPKQTPKPSQVATDMWLAGFTPTEIRSYLASQGYSEPYLKIAVDYMFDLDALTAAKLAAVKGATL